MAVRFLRNLLSFCNVVVEDKMKIIWKVQQAERRYASFHKRGFPSAEYENGEMAFSLHCDHSYSGRLIKSGQDLELELWVADHQQKPWKWRRFKQRFASIPAAKEFAKEWIGNHPEFLPKVAP